MGEAALREDTLQHHLSMLDRSCGVERPDMGDSSLICLGDALQLILQLLHRRLIGLSSTLEVWSMAIATYSVLDLAGFYS